MKYENMKYLIFQITFVYRYYRLTYIELYRNMDMFERFTISGITSFIKQLLQDI